MRGFFVLCTVCYAMGVLAQDERKSPTQTFDHFPITIETAHGITRIAQQPQRVITLGTAAQDWCVLLGVIPVAIEAEYWGGDKEGYTPWFRDKLQTLGAQLPPVLSSYPELNIEKVIALKPDLVLAPYSGMSAETYKQLSTFVPVISYPKTPWLISAKEQALLIGKALGRSKDAQALVKQQDQFYQKLKQNYPHYQGLKMAYVHASYRSGQLNAYAQQDPRMSIFLKLGFQQLPQLVKMEQKNKQFFIPVGLESANILDEADLIISWFSSEAAKQQMMHIPLIQRIPAVRSHHFLALTDRQIITALSSENPLSLAWSVPRFMQKLQRAALGQGE